MACSLSFIIAFALGWLTRACLAERLPGLMLAMHPTAARLWWAYRSRRRRI
jgi:hypothetical protein